MAAEARKSLCDNEACLGRPTPLTITDSASHRQGSLIRGANRRHRLPRRAKCGDPARVIGTSANGGLDAIDHRPAHVFRLDDAHPYGGGCRGLDQVLVLELALRPRGGTGLGSTDEHKKQQGVEQTRRRIEPDTRRDGHDNDRNGTGSEHGEGAERGGKKRDRPGANAFIPSRPLFCGVATVLTLTNHAPSRARMIAMIVLSAALRVWLSWV